MDKHKSSLLANLTGTYRNLLTPLSFSGLEEIRFRVGRPVMLYRGDGFSYVTPLGTETDQAEQGKICTSAELAALTSALCQHSVYAHLNDIKDGFISLHGGHRAGLSGKAVMKDGAPSGLSDISSVNLRIARAFPDCAAPILPHLMQGGRPKNTLLIGPPNCGKTTHLRDLARLLSTGYKICIVDERSEIAGSREGVPQFDVGIQTDVLDRVPKSVGMLLAVRSLSPHILITDELGTDADVDAIRQAACTGCRFIASIHGDSVEKLQRTHPDLLKCFELAVVLGRRGGHPAIITTKELTHNA